MEFGFGKNGQSLVHTYVIPSSQYEGIGGLGSADEAIFKDFFFPAVHSEVFGATNQRECQVRSMRLQNAPKVD